MLNEFFNKILRKIIKLIILTTLKDFNNKCTSTISASISRRVTADNRFLAALTILLRLAEAQGSSANSLAAILIASPT